MKQCPQCNRTYADESITFCLADGALLSASYDSEATQRISPRLSTSPQPTEILPAHQPVKQKSSPKFIYAVVGVMAVLLIVLASIIIVPLMSKDQKESKDLAQANSTNTKPTHESSNIDPRRTVVANINESAVPPITSSNSSISNPSSASSEVTGRWQGQWSSPFGTIFSANLYLEATGNSNGVQGTINWTMQSTRQGSKQSKIGLTAVEYVRGSFNPETHLVTMEGFRKDDPNDIISLDKYRLVLAASSRSLGGATWNHGGWRGRLSLTR